MHKDHQANIAGLQDLVGKLRQTQLQLTQENTDRYQTSQLHTNELRHRLDSVTKQMQVLEQSRYAAEAGGAQGQPPSTATASLEGSIASVKEATLLERQKRDGQYEELNRQALELQAVI